MVHIITVQTRCFAREVGMIMLLDKKICIMLFIYAYIYIFQIDLRDS
jgi:hypothetical protein